jgi:hypothetical protein
VNISCVTSSSKTSICNWSAKFKWTNVCVHYYEIYFTCIYRENVLVHFELDVASLRKIITNLPVSREYYAWHFRSLIYLARNIFCSLFKIHIVPIVWYTYCHLSMKIHIVTTIFSYVLLPLDENTYCHYSMKLHVVVDL